MRNFCCFRCINKSYPENGIALHGVPFFFNKCVRRRKNMDRFCTATTNSLFDFLKYWRHVHNNWQLPVKHRYLLMQQSLYSLSIKASCQALRGQNEQQGLVWISLPCKSASRYWEVPAYITFITTILLKKPIIQLLHFFVAKIWVSLLQGVAHGLDKEIGPVSHKCSNSDHTCQN